ncbi:MAG: hypothetical protein ISR65_11915 [Bacteriovoracaceae bacterium]|nr:hypothetical protein [Bacteriovoracaceae bacterium]
MKRITSLFICYLLIIPNYALSIDWKSVKCPTDVKVLARELLEVELAGRQLPKKGPCLDQNKFNYVSATHSPREEIKLKVDKVLDGPYKISIKEPKDLGLGEFELKFHIANKGLSYEDKIRVLILHAPEVASNHPCGELTLFPKQFMVRKQCLKN